MNGGDRTSHGRGTGGGSGGGKWRLAGNLGFLFPELPWAARPGAARDAGLRFVEFPWPPDPDGLAVALEAAGVTPVLVNVAAGDLAAGDRGFAHLPERVAEWRAALDAALAFAVRTGCPTLNVLAGIARPAATGPAATGPAATGPATSLAGNSVTSAAGVTGGAGGIGGAGPLGEGAGVAWRCLVGNLRWAVVRARAVGVGLVVEAVNGVDSPGYLVPRVADVVGLLEEVGTTGVRVQLDTYHCAVEGDDPVEWVRRLGARLGHVQVADHPGRHEPGSGRLDLGGLFGALREIGYGGAVGLEYVPAGEPVADVVRRVAVL